MAPSLSHLVFNLGAYGLPLTGVRGEQTSNMKGEAPRRVEPAILIMTSAIGIQIGIGTEIDEKARNSTPIAIAISISTVRMNS